MQRGVKVTVTVQGEKGWWSVWYFAGVDFVWWCHFER